MKDINRSKKYERKKENKIISEKNLMNEEECAPIKKNFKHKKL